MGQTTQVLSSGSRPSHGREPYDEKLSRTIQRALSRQELIITWYKSLTLSTVVYFYRFPILATDPRLR